MNIISTLRSKQKTLMIVASLLLGLALSPIDAIAANDRHDGYRNNDRHQTSKHQGNRHTEKNMRHHNNGHQNKHAYSDNRYYAPRWDHRYDQHRHQHHYYHTAPPYMVDNHRHTDRLGLQIGVYTDDFNIFLGD